MDVCDCKQCDGKVQLSERQIRRHFEIYGPKVQWFCISPEFVASCWQSVAAIDIDSKHDIPRENDMIDEKESDPELVDKQGFIEWAAGSAASVKLYESSSLTVAQFSLVALDYQVH